jgi:hypothetical protein
MAKGQIRSNREKRKPKAEKPAAPIVLSARGGGAAAAVMTHITGQRKTPGYLERGSAATPPRNKS